MGENDKPKVCSGKHKINFELVLLFKNLEFTRSKAFSEAFYFCSQIIVIQTNTYMKNYDKMSSR